LGEREEEEEEGVTEEETALVHGLHRLHGFIQRREDMGEEAGLLHDKLTYLIIGCAQKVHATLGPGFPEAVYQKAMCLELIRSKAPFENEKAYEVAYEGVICGEFRADLVVGGAVVVELKALASLNGDHLAQVLAYLKASGLKVGLMLNFGRQSLEVKRVVL
jgi:GxxExxY protein